MTEPDNCARSYWFVFTVTDNRSDRRTPHPRSMATMARSRFPRSMAGSSAASSVFPCSGSTLASGEVRKTNLAGEPLALVGPGCTNS
jgi:hypothetical protein